MHKKISVIIFLIFSCFLNASAQHVADTLFQRDLIHEKKFIEGKKYLLHSNKRNRPVSENGRTSFVKEGETPVFAYRGKVQNGINYAAIGNNPLTYLGLEPQQAYMVEKDTVLFNVLRFSCKEKIYKLYRAERWNTVLYNDLTDLAVLEELENALVGKTVYTLSAKWMKYNKENINTNHEYTAAKENTYKYVPVEITSIINDYDDKYIIHFKHADDENTYAFENVQFGKYTLNSSSNFCRRMTFEDPKSRYPGISAKRWKKIQAQQIEKGFTKEEVIITLGEPDGKCEMNNEDIWVYYNTNKMYYVICFKKRKVKQCIVGPAEDSFYRVRERLQ